MKISVFTTALFFIVGHHMVLSQDLYSTDEDSARAFRVDSILPPHGLATLNLHAKTTSAVVVWMPLDGITSYTLRVYTRSNSVLYKELQNLVVTLQNITGLESGTEYAVTVSAVYTGRNGQVESSESEPIYFFTVRECTGGQVRTQCTAHCVSTCDNPDPVCARICTSGCACPRSMPIWHEDLCIPRPLCPPPTGRPLTPINVRVLPSARANDVLLTWDPIDNAVSYTIRVKLASNRDKVIRTLESIIPLVEIYGLSPGEIYIFSVRANMRKQPTIRAKSTLLPPNDLRISRVTENGFHVSWSSRNEAVKYAFILYDESRENVIYINEQIAGNTINIEGLAPGTIYYYSVATAGSKRNPAIFSNLRGVRTYGETTTDLDAYHSAEIVQSVLPTTTAVTTTTTAPLTLCQERYASVASFYEAFPSVLGPRYPNCDDQGLFVTVECFPDAPSVCWCVNPVDGERVPGSDFGGHNSNIRLDCDQFGSFNTDPITVEVDLVKSNSIRVRWSEASNVYGYVLSMDNGEDDTLTMSVDSDVHSHMLTNLLSGQTYIIGVFAVNDEGWTSSISKTQVTTNFIDTPEDFKVDEVSGSSVTLSWKYDPNAEYYSITLIATHTSQPLRQYSRVLENSMTIKGLDSSLAYTVEVRAHVSAANDGSELISHVSEAAIVKFEARECRQSRAVDVIYVVDTSRASAWIGLQRQKDFFINITAGLPEVDAEIGTRIAAVRYYQRASTVFNYNRFSRSNHVIGSLKYLRYNGSPLSALEMLRYVTSTYFSDTQTNSAYTTRDSAVSVVVVFYPGGTSESVEDITLAASQLKERTNIIAVGIDGQTSDAELSAIASDSSLAVKVSSYSNLEEAVKPVLNKICSLS